MPEVRKHSLDTLATELADRLLAIYNADYQAGTVLNMKIFWPLRNACFLAFETHLADDAGEQSSSTEANNG